MSVFVKIPALSTLLTSVCDLQLQTAYFALMAQADATAVQNVCRPADEYGYDDARR